MAVRYYDEALLEKIKKWVKDPNMTITGPDETRRLFQYLGDINDDKPLKLPIIALRRLTPVRILSTNKKPLTYDGWRKNNNGEKGDQLNAIPIEINYQLDIYTRYMAEADEYSRNFIFQIINHPKLSIEIPYNNAKIMHDSNIRLSENIDDNSGIPERLIEGQFTRLTLSINIDDAYLFDYRIKDNWRVESELQTVIKNDTTIDEIILENKERE